MNKKLILGILIGSLLAMGLTIFAALPIFRVEQGSTGTGTVPTSGQILIGNASSTYTPAYIVNETNIGVATSSGNLTMLWLGTLADGRIASASNWNTAYNYSQVGHLPLTGGTISGNLGVSGTSTFTGTSTFSGNVGIGTVTPAYTLDVNGTMRVTGDTILATTTITTLTVSNAFNLNGVVGTGIDMDGGLITNIAGSNFVSGGGLDLAGNFSVAGTSAFTGTSTFADKVGIATTSPDYDLDVNGTLRVVNSTILATTTVTDITATGLSKVSVYLGTNQTVTSTENTTIKFDTVVFDTLNEFSTSTHRFTALKSGYYHVDAQLAYISPIADKRYSVIIYRNSTSMSDRTLHASWASYLAVIASKTFYMTAGQYVEIQTYNDSTDPNEEILNGESVAFMTIYRLP